MTLTTTTCAACGRTVHTLGGPPSEAEGWQTNGTTWACRERCARVLEERAQAERAPLMPWRQMRGTR